MAEVGPFGTAKQPSGCTRPLTRRDSDFRRAADWGGSGTGWRSYYSEGEKRDDDGQRADGRTDGQAKGAATSLPGHLERASK